MPITPMQEFFNKGLVNVRDPSLLTSGELQQCDHCVYRPFDPAIHGAPGRQAIHSTPFTGPIKGLAWCSSDAISDQLLAYNGPDLYLASFTAITGLVWTKVQGIGSLSDDPSGVGSEQMTVIKYDTAQYIFNGRDTGRVIRFTAPSPMVITGCTIAGTTTVTATTANVLASVIIGQTVTGTNVPPGTVVSAKNYTQVVGVYTVTSLTLSQACTNGTDLTLTFTYTYTTAARVMGMQSTSVMLTPPAILQSGSLYAWPNSGLYGGNGYYWFFYTEAYMPGAVDEYDKGYIESAATIKDNDLQRVQITDQAHQGIMITRNPLLVNDGGTNKVQATHWIIYMSPMSPDPLKIPSRNLFVRIGNPIQVDLTSFNLTTTALNSGRHNPTAYENVTGYSAVETPTGCFERGGSSTYFPRHDYPAYSGYAVKTFNFPDSSLTPTSIDLYLWMTWSGRDGADGNGLSLVLEVVRVSDGVVLKRSPPVNATLSGGRFYSYDAGGTSFIQRHGLFSPPTSWTGHDFFDGGTPATYFRILIYCYWWSSELDEIYMQVNYGGFPPDFIGPNYRTVTYRSQVGTSVIDSAALPPPEAPITGAVFHGQLVLNDHCNRNSIRYSQVGYPEYFPRPYFITFDSVKKDVVTNIKRVGQMLIVGLQDSINRVNYLPTELDVDSQGSPAYEPIATDHGICGPLAAVTVDLPGLGTVLVYCSFKGIHYTTGARPEFLNTDLDWSKTVDKTALSTAILTVYPAMNWIILLYCPYQVTPLHSRNTRMLIFNYSPDKIKEGGVLPAIGPITVSGRSVAAPTLNGVDYLLTGHEADGFVYAEDQGSSLPAGYYTQEDANPATHTVTKNTPVIRTRLFYAAGLERDTRVERTYLRYDTNGTIVSVSSCVLSGSTLTKTSAFASVVNGMTVTGVGIRPGTIVISHTSSVVTLSHAVETAGTADIVFDTGTLEITIRGQGMRDALATIEAGHISTYEGNLNDIHLDDTRQALELQIRKTALPDGTLVDLGTAMRLHYFTALLSESGMEEGRPA